LSCQSRKEYYHSLVEKTKEKNMHRLQTETSRTNNVDKDKLSETDECEPSAEPKAKAARRNFQSTWLEKFKWLRYDNTKGMLFSISIESRKANPFTSGCINFRTSALTSHVESQDHQNALKEVDMAAILKELL